MAKCTACGGSGRVIKNHWNKDRNLSMGPGLVACGICGGTGKGGFDMTGDGDGQAATSVSAARGENSWNNMVGFARMVSWPLFLIAMIVAFFTAGTELFGTTAIEAWPDWFRVPGVLLTLVGCAAILFFQRRRILILGLLSVVFLVLSFDLMVEHSKRRDADLAVWEAGAQERAERARCERWGEERVAQLIREAPDSSNARMCARYVTE